MINMQASLDLIFDLLDLHQIFLDMSIAVAGQAEMLDRIEGWVRPVSA